MKHLLILGLFGCAACSGAFDTGVDPPSIDGGGDAVASIDAPRDDAGLVIEAATDDRAAPVEVGSLEASSDSAVGCEYYPPVYYTLDKCVTASADASNGFALPNTFILSSATGKVCVGASTPAACTCSGTYDCACMLPALLVEQAMQKAHAADAAPGLLCAGTLTGCTVDALGVIHVTCS